MSFLKKVNNPFIEDKKGGGILGYRKILPIKTLANSFALVRYSVSKKWDFTLRSI